MRTIFPLLLLGIILSGCAAASTSTIKVEKPKDFYVGMFTLVVNMDSDFSQLDSAFYEQHVRGKFNNLEKAKRRDRLENSLALTLQEQAQTRIVKSSEVFALNTDVSYNKFVQDVRASGVDGILLVNERNTWVSKSLTTIHDDDISTSSIDELPNAAFHTYLIDSHSLRPVWYANSTVRGSYVADFNTLNNHLVRSLYRKLKKDNYILTKATVTK